ncbi:MAG TPA: NAD-dependent epimerase/dehydratase family protein [Bacteroidia bacterium]|nr:NAD-dependent epimerase/dehydratase family protein [Bacteroidia bacterium]
MSEKLKIIITGVTGMVGEGVLHECLKQADVETVLVVNRKPCGINHPKLKEIIHKDFFNLDSIANELSGYNTCLFCLGVSSVGMKEEEYYKLTYTLTLGFATIVAKVNSNMTFEYISGAATDSTEKGRVMWARVKGKTENDLTKLPFKAVYNFRPGYMHPTKELKNTNKYYKYITWLYPVLRKLFPQHVSTLQEMGMAMINAARFGYNKQILEVKDIVELAHKA